MATKSTKDTEVKSDEDILAMCNQLRQLSFVQHTQQETYFVNYVLSVANFPY